MNKKITYVAGGGGAPAAYIHMGIAGEFIKNNIDIKDQIGTSAGSIIGGYLACYISKFKSLNICAIEELIHKDFSNLKDQNIFGLLSYYFCRFILQKTYINKLGLIKGKMLYKDLLDITYGMKFKDLSNGINLYITATELLTGSLVVFSKESTPNVLVADAIRASSSIQGVFVPQGIELTDVINGLYVDNDFKSKHVDDENFNPNIILNQYGIKNNTKLYFIDGGNNGNCRTDIASNVKEEDSQIVATSFTQKGINNMIKVDSFIDILQKTVKIMMQATENVVIEYSQLKYPDMILLRPNDLNIGTTDFGLNIETKQKLVQEGIREISQQLV